MMFTRLLIIAFLLLLQLTVISCKEQIKTNDYNEKNEGCQSKVISFMFIVDDINNVYKANSEASEQGMLREMLLDTLSYKTKKIIEMSGGIKEGTDQLFSGCDSSKQYQEYFENNLTRSVGQIYKGLDASDPMSRHFIDVLNEYFFSDAPYFTDSYFSGSNLVQLSYDLFIVQLSLIISPHTDPPISLQADPPVSIDTDSHSSSLQP